MEHIARDCRGKGKERAQGQMKEMCAPRAKARQATGRQTVASSAATGEELKESPRVEDTKDNAGHVQVARVSTGSRCRRRE